jgi:hypothetical protein
MVLGHAGKLEALANVVKKDLKRGRGGIGHDCSSPVRAMSTSTNAPEKNAVEVNATDCKAVAESPCFHYSET